MKKILLIVMAFLSYTTCIVSQTSNALDPVIAPIDTTQEVSDISKISHNIKNNIDNLLRIPVYNDSLSSRNVYLQDNKLQMVIIKHIEDKIEKNVEWYFFAERLIYAESNWVSTETRKTVSSTKCYFNNLHMIAWVNDGKYMKSGTDEYKQREKQLVEYSKTLWVNAMKKD